MMRDVGGGCVSEEGQRAESLFLIHCLVQGTQLEQLPLLRQHFGAVALHLQL